MEGLTALDVLETMYGPGCLEKVWAIVVITKGSCYLTHSEGRSDTPVFWPFEQGEILFLNGYGREPFGEGRKPSKWDVEGVVCSTLAEAKLLSELTKSLNPQFMPDYKLEWTDEERERWDG